MEVSEISIFYLPVSVSIVNRVNHVFYNKKCRRQQVRPLGQIYMLILATYYPSARGGVGFDGGAP